MLNNLKGKKAILDNLATMPEPKRRKLLGLMLASPALGMAAMLQGCGGSGNGEPDSGSTASSSSASSSSSSSSSSSASEMAKISAFTLMMLPDTQFYPRYACAYMGELYQKRYADISGYHDNPMKSQTQWIAGHASALNTAFTMHLGDVVDQSYYYSGSYESSSPWSSSTDLTSGTQLSDGTVTKEWELASQAMEVLEDAGCGYSILAGNHDVGANGSTIQWGPDWGIDCGTMNNSDGYTDGGTYRTSYDQPYLHVFPEARAARQATFGGRHSSGFHEYHIFEAEGSKWLSLAMSWRASDAAIAWANSIIAAHPTLPVILTCHQYAGIGDDTTTAVDTSYSDYLWENLVSNNDQIFMIVSGHYHGSCYTKKTNAAGNDVHIMVVDYQMDYMGGNGLMRMYEFDLSNSQVIASSFSPWVIEKPANDLNDFDVAWKTASNHSFSFDLDFKSRFAGFNADFAIPEASVSGSLTATAQTLILANYTDPQEDTGTEASGTDDYPIIAGTSAHWRFYDASATDGTAVKSTTTTITDISGNDNTLTLMTWTAGSSTATWSTDHHRLSATPGSVQFSGATKTAFNYFVTQTDAPVNTLTFENGYTVEAFIYIDPDWSVANGNAWMGVLYRLGARSNNPSAPVSSNADSGDTMMMFALSNLMEIQWDVVPAAGGDSDSCWSGGISAGQWYHVAIVNDPDDDYSTTMYVEGAPILRNVTNMQGFGYAGEALTCVGASQYAGSMEHGWFGKIGEVRIVPKVLTSDQWLTARAGT